VVKPASGEIARRTGPNSAVRASAEMLRGPGNDVAPGTTLRSHRQAQPYGAGVTGDRTASSLAGLITAISLHNWLAAGTAAVGMLPAIWTFWKANGGWTGIMKRIRFGDDPAPARSRRRLESAKAA
jgi:hypothetical protein